ncbi:hypothetical protein B0H13DRAFT_2417588 [Mycena leptocephala]|nr:hypothetical protein B0H13DRAFT_2417588 [Mycena leptocephala]
MPEGLTICGFLANVQDLDAWYDELQYARRRQPQQRMSSRHSSQGPVPLPTATPPATATTLDTLQPPTPTSPTFASPPISPTATSKLLRFLKSPDRSKSLSVNWPPSAASSSASHGTSASYTTNTSNSTSTSSASGRRGATRFLGLGKVAAGLAYIVRLCAEQPARRVRHREPAHTLRAAFLCIHTPALFQFFQLWPRTATRLDACAQPESMRCRRPAGDAVERVSTGHGSSGTGSSTVVPHSHGHGQTPTSPRMQHSPSQSDSSSATSSSRGESGGSVGGAGAGRQGHRSAHGSAHPQGSSTYSNASYSSYASYSSPGTPSSTSTSNSNKKKWWPLPRIGGIGMGSTKG